MAGFFLHKPNGTLFASTLLGDEFFTVAATELRDSDVSWTIGGSYFQSELPFLESKLDLEELSFTMGRVIEPSFEELRPYIKANETAGIPLRLCPAHKLGKPFNNWLKRKLESAQHFYDELFDEDVEFGSTICNSRRQILDSMGEFVYCGEEMKIDWSKKSQKAGRLSIESGFNPMVLKKTERYKVRSKTKGRHIVYCDFKALEFRVALKALGLHDYEDVTDPYSAIAEDIELECDQRSIYKNAMIALLYGSSLKYAQLSDADRIALINWFADNMDTSSMVEEAMEDVDVYGYIRSLFGRRIKEGDDVTDKMIINNIFQASGADFVFTAYAKLLKLIAELGIDAIPIFMIHDSIVFDVSDSALEKLAKITRIDGYPIEWGSFAE